MEFVLEFLANIIYICSFICIGKGFFDFERRNNKYRIVFLLVLIFFTTVLGVYAHILVRTVTHILCIGIILWLFFKENGKDLAVFGLGVTAIISMLELIIDVVISAMNIYIKSSMSEKEIDIVSQAIVLLFVWLAGHYFSKRYPGELKKLGTRYLLVFAILLFLDSTIVIMFGHYVINIVEAERKWILVLLYLGVVAGVLVQIVLLINTLITRNIHKEKETLAKKYLENQSEHYLYLEKREEQTKKFRHDIRNHLIVLGDLAKQRDYEGVEDYVNTLNEKVNMFGNRISVNNGVADAILNRFYDEAQEDGILLKVSGHFPLNCKLTAYDMCTILSNLVSNAVRAEKEAGGEKVIIEIRYTDKETMIIIENDYVHELRVESGKFITTKKDGMRHGFGLINVQECVEKNGGCILISTENQKFVARLVLKNE